jgi:hypothetical protein
VPACLPERSGERSIETSQGQDRLHLLEVSSASPKKEDLVLYPLFLTPLSPRTYAFRKSEAEDPVAKNRSAIFLMSALRSPINTMGQLEMSIKKKKGYYIEKELMSTELTRQRCTRPRSI